MDVKSIVLDNGRIQRIWHKVPTSIEKRIRNYNDYLRQYVLKNEMHIK